MEAKAMSQREHVRQLEDAIDKAAAACLKQNPVEAYRALAPFCSEDVVATNPPEAEPGKPGVTPAAGADATTPPATAAAPGPAAPATGTEERTRRRNRPGRRRFF